MTDTTETTETTETTTTATTSSGSSRWFFWGLGGAAAVALAVRLYIIFVDRPTADVGAPGGHSYVLGGDAFYYHWQARGFTEGLWFVDPVSWQQLDVIQPSAGHVPLYSSFLGVVSWLGAESVTAHRVASTFLGVAAVVVIGLLARKLAGDRAGLIAAGIAALYPQLWINDGMLLSESMAILMIALTLLAAYQFWEHPTWKWAAVLGAAIGLTTLSRSEQVLMFVLIVIPLVWGLRQFAWKERLRLAGVCALAGLVVLAPWLIYTGTQFDKPVLLTSGTGLILASGSCDEVFYGKYLGYYANCLEEVPPLGIDETQREASARREALDYLSEHKSRLPIVAAARVGRIWGVFKPSQTTFFDWWLEGRGHWASVVGAFSYYLLMPFAIGGVVVLRRRKIPISPIIALAIIVTLAAATTFGVTRYRTPAEVGIVVAAAVCADAIIRWLRSRTAAST
jgi:4-amino-4-deoxy-L-arabinose transferase-like glycosyltransferase